MKISIVSPESRVSVRCKYAAMQQVKKFNYLGVVFTSDERRNKKIGTRIAKANAVLRELYRSGSQNGFQTHQSS